MGLLSLSSSLLVHAYEPNREILDAASGMCSCVGLTTAYGGSPGTTGTTSILPFILIPPVTVTATVAIAPITVSIAPVSGGASSIGIGAPMLAAPCVSTTAVTLVLKVVVRDRQILVDVAPDAADYIASRGGRESGQLAALKSAIKSALDENQNEEVKNLLKEISDEDLDYRIVQSIIASAMKNMLEDDTSIDHTI